MPKIKICLAGVTGKVGRLLARAVADSDDIELVSGVSKNHAGKKLSDILHLPTLDVDIHGSVEKALATPADVLVDYTSASVVKNHALTAISRHIHVVIGTSGLTNQDYETIDHHARQQGVGVFAAGNFSITAALMQKFSMIATKYCNQWEVIDYGSSTKTDAPSGTAREMAFVIGKPHHPHPDVPIEKTVGEKAARGLTLDGTQVHSIRLPGFFSSCETLFGLPNERLTIRHDSIGIEPYISGTLLAIRHVTKIRGLKRGLLSILEN